MKNIILDGIATSGKTVFGHTLKNFLEEKNVGYKIVHFNDELRKLYSGLDTLGLKKDPIRRNKLNVREVSEFLSGIVDELQKIETKDKENYLFVIDRLHYSYMDSLNVSSKDFKELENKIRNYSYYFCMNFENPTDDLLYSRIKSSLELRSEHPFTSRHFKRLVGEETSEEIQKQLIWNHYGSKINKYDETFKDTILRKKKIFVDKAIHKDDYSKLLTSEIKDDLLDFVRN